MGHPFACDFVETAYILNRRQGQPSTRIWLKKHLCPARMNTGLKP